MSQVPNGRQTFDHLRHLLHRQRSILLATMGVCLVAGLLYSRTTRIYRATARCTADAAGATQADAAVESRPAGNFLRTQSEFITSRSILALALANPEVKPLLTFRKMPGRLALTALRDSIHIDLGRVDDVISVSVDSPYAEEAPILVNAVVAAYKQYQSQPARSNTDDVLATYQAQVDKIRAQLTAATGQLQAMEQQYGVLSSTGDPHNNITLNRLGTISQELTAAQFEALKAKSDFDEASKELEKNSPQSAAASKFNAPVLVSADQEEKLRVEMIELQSRREALRQRYLAGHPALVEIGQQIDAVNRDYVAAVRQRWLLADKRQQELQGAFDVAQKQLIAVSAKTAEYERLRADADRYRKSVDNLESRAQAIQASRDSVGVRVDFFDPAQGSAQVHPLPLPTLLMTLLVGSLLSVGVAMLRDWMDDRLRSTEDVRDAMELPVLGVVPQAMRAMKLNVAAQKVALDPTSEVAQAYRLLRGTLVASARRNRSRTIVVTSANEGDGKTTSAVNLSIAMAQTGQRVLLVDAVLREPQLHTIFNVSSTSGLANLLGGQNIAVEKAIRKTMIEGLSVLPGGIKTVNSTELLNSPAFPELLEQLADSYDHIVIDSPALAGLHDARIIAASCDLTVLVLRADTITRRSSRVARDALVSVGAHLAGIILTRAPSSLEIAPVIRNGRKHSSVDLDPESDVIDLSSTAN